MWRVRDGVRLRGVGLFYTALCVAAVTLSAAPTGNVTHGKELYRERCVLCHGDAGQGWDWSQKVMRPPVAVPNLVEIVPQRSDEYLARVIRDGGEAVGLTRFMPAFGFNMSEEDVRDVVAYLRSLPHRSK